MKSLCFVFYHELVIKSHECSKLQSECQSLRKQIITSAFNNADNLKTDDENVSQSV